MKIMLGYNQFPLDSNVITVTLDQAKAFKAQVHLVTSMAVGEEVPKIEFDTAEENLNKAKQFFLDQGIDCVARLIETGMGVEEDLVQYAETHKIDEVIIGVKSRSKLGKLIFGSTAQYVILKSSCPVVAVKASAVEDEDE
jgi:nucleotide-binding universal stress UspA family protein